MDSATKYVLCVGLVCLICPPVFCFVVGVGIFYGAAHIVYKIIS
jgi:uncharacterized membrane protein